VRPGQNPTRRNRNIGTAKQGHGQNNQFVVPQSWHTDRLANQTLGKFQKIESNLAGRKLTFLIEETNGGCQHPCSVADVYQIFKHIPFADWAGLQTIVFRQPSKKQRLLNPVWGRLFYFAQIGQRTGKYLSEGPAIILEAMPPEGKFVWSRSLGPEDAAELSRLVEDGHKTERSGKEHVILTTANANRQTQLFRTVLHEVGHWVDYLEKVERPSDDGIESFDALNDRYFARPRQEREAFAHRYADELGLKLRTFGIIPFERIED
jgi:hypothetical protein